MQVVELDHQLPVNPVKRHRSNEARAVGLGGIERPARLFLGPLGGLDVACRVDAEPAAWVAAPHVELHERCGSVDSEHSMDLRAEPQVEVENLIRRRQLECLGRSGIGEPEVLGRYPVHTKGHALDSVGAVGPGGGRLCPYVITGVALSPRGSPVAS